MSHVDLMLLLCTALYGGNVKYAKLMGHQCQYVCESHNDDVPGLYALVLYRPRSVDALRPLKGHWAVSAMATGE